jgi:hypothetical protein
MLRRGRRELDRWQTPMVMSVNYLVLTIFGIGFAYKTNQARLEVNLDGSWEPRGTSSWFDTRIKHNSPPLPPGTKVRVVNCRDNTSNELVVV